MDLILLIIAILTILVSLLLGWQVIYFINYKREINSTIKKNVDDLSNRYRYELDDFKKDIIENEINTQIALVIIFSQLNNENSKSLGITHSIVFAEILRKYNKYVEKDILTNFLQTIHSYNINDKTSLEDLREYRNMVSSFDFGLEAKNLLLKSLDHYIDKQQHRN